MAGSKKKTVVSNLQAVSLGDIVIYRANDRTKSLYQVVSEPVPTNKGLEFELRIINPYGTLGKKSFYSTMTRVDGEQRIFRSWVQPKDRVRVTYAQGSSYEGVVQCLMFDSGNETAEISVEVMTDKRQQLLMSLAEAREFLEFI